MSQPEKPAKPLQRIQAELIEPLLDMLAAKVAQRIAIMSAPKEDLFELYRVAEIRQRNATKIRDEFERRLYDQSAIESPITLKLVEEIASAGVRSLARIYHPDAGGDHDKMVTINNAANWLRATARAEIFVDWRQHRT